MPVQLDPGQAYPGALYFNCPIMYCDFSCSHAPVGLGINDSANEPSAANLLDISGSDGAGQLSDCDDVVY